MLDDYRHHEEETKSDLNMVLTKNLAYTICKTLYHAHVKNEVVFERMSENRELINSIRSQKMELFFEHIMRNMKIENTVVTGMIGGRREENRDCQKEVEQLDGDRRTVNDYSITRLIETKRRDIPNLDQADSGMEHEEEEYKFR